MTQRVSGAARDPSAFMTHSRRPAEYAIREPSGAHAENPSEVVVLLSRVEPPPFGLMTYTASVTDSSHRCGMLWNAPRMRDSATPAYRNFA
jgi:hypothetical protein